MTASPALPPTRVLYVEPYFWRCGPHNALVNLLSHLDRDRWDPHVALPRHGQATEDFARLDVPVYRRPFVGNLGLKRGLPGLGVGLARSLLGALQVALLARRLGVRLVHVNGEACLAGLLGAWLARRPAVVHVHGLGWSANPFLRRAFAAVARATGCGAIACSRAVQRELLGSGLGAATVHLIYNGIDTDRFSPPAERSALRRGLGLRDDAPTVGMVAHLDPRKGHHVFLEAAAMIARRVPDVSFVIAGGPVPMDPPPMARRYQAELAEWVRRLELQDRVCFLGDRGDIPQVLATLDVVVQPSLAEAGPLVPLEAMSAGRAVVVTDVGGSSEEVVHGETGLVVPPGDPQALAEAVLSLLSDAGLRRRMGDAGRCHVLERYSATAMASNVEGLYYRLLSRPGARMGSAALQGVAIPEEDAPKDGGGL